MLVMTSITFSAWKIRYIGKWIDEKAQYMLYVGGVADHFVSEVK